MPLPLRPIRFSIRSSLNKHLLHGIVLLTLIGEIRIKRTFILVIESILETAVGIPSHTHANRNPHTEIHYICVLLP